MLMFFDHYTIMIFGVIMLTSLYILIENMYGESYFLFTIFLLLLLTGLMCYCLMFDVTIAHAAGPDNNSVKEGIVERKSSISEGSETSADPDIYKSMVEDFDNPVVTLLNANMIITLTILYIMLLMIVLFLFYIISVKKWDLSWIETKFGSRVFNIVNKLLIISSKNNLIWIMIGFVFIGLGNISLMYISYFLLNNFDDIINVYLNNKN